MREFDRRLAAALAEMEASKIKLGNGNPPLFRLLQRRGFDVPPPLYAAPHKVALGMGGLFGGTWGLMMWAITWSSSGMPWQIALLSAICAGALFAAGMTLYYSFLKKKHSLTPWHAL